MCSDHHVMPENDVRTQTANGNGNDVTSIDDPVTLRLVSLLRTFIAAVFYSFGFTSKLQLLGLGSAPSTKHFHQNFPFHRRSSDIVVGEKRCQLIQRNTHRDHQTSS
jgi:hypothetical protein